MMGRSGFLRVLEKGAITSLTAGLLEAVISGRLAYTYSSCRTWELTSRPKMSIDGGGFT